MAQGNAVNSNNSTTYFSFPSMNLEKAVNHRDTELKNKRKARSISFEKWKVLFFVAVDAKGVGNHLY